MPLHVTEYANVAFLPNAVGMIPQEPPLADYTVAIGGSSAQSPTFQLGTRMVRVETDAICSILFGFALAGGPVATTANARFVAGQTEYRGVPEGGRMQVAVIANT
ncbi:MAG TPA: hypothetical protein VFN27_16935 [Xanthobacteraceae bacterium]|nr:hypothetical protein [Xanthobacteraceae bacterium]